MKNLKRLEKVCPDGIPFSKCKEYLNKKSKTKKSKRKRKRSRPNKSKVPPKGVVIRKGKKLYKSTGSKLKTLINKQVG